MIAAAMAQFETQLAESIHVSVVASQLRHWQQTIMSAHGSGLSVQSWLWAAPAKHSTRQIAEMFERIEFLRELGVHEQLIDVPDVILRRYARRLTSRPPSAGARIKSPRAR